MKFQSSKFKVQNQEVLKILQLQAREALERYHVPPQRYGTAFHVRPPALDVRELFVSPELALDVGDWESLSAVDRQRIMALDLTDVYLARLLAQGIGEVMVVREGEKQLLSLPPLRLLTEPLPLRQGEKTSQAPVLFIILEAGARLTIENIITDEQLALRRLFVWQKEGSLFNFTGWRAGNSFLNERVEIFLTEPRAHAQVCHLIYGQNQEQADIVVRVHHEARETTSNVMVRSAAADQHTAIYRGLIDVHHEARGAQGYQQGRGLILSPKAVIDMVPELTIATNDVACSHGVSTTHLDDLALFYMRSRGISAATARKLAVRGFYERELALPDAIVHQMKGAV